MFESFKNLKHEYKLGESKYKKLSFDKDNLTKKQENRYQYTFKQVISEAELYGLVIRDDDKLAVTNKGRDLLYIYYEEGLLSFNRLLFRYMEDYYHAFYYLVQFCYEANRKKGGLLIFPNYSPLKLQIERSKINSVGDIINYSNQLTRKLEDDIDLYLGEKRNLKGDNDELIQRLKKTGFLSENNSDPFSPGKYNVIIKRFRDFWLTYFLKNLSI